MPTVAQPSPEQLEEHARSFYLRSMEILDEMHVPYLVGGGYALACHTGVKRQTKDLDIFMRQEDSRRALDVLSRAGYRTELTWPHFLVKAISDPAFIDILYNSGNGLSPVDDQWFAHAPEGEVLGRLVLLCPPEEMIWSKAFVQERDRFDGADVMHLIGACGSNFDWPRLIARFRTHEPVLLGHLMMFGYVYPSERRTVPDWVLDELWAKIRSEPPSSDRICRGTFLSQSQYRIDISERGYADPRLRPLGTLTPDDIRKLAGL